MERFTLPRTNTVFHNSLSPRCPYPSHPQPNELLLSDCFPSGAFHPSDHSLQNRHLEVQIGKNSFVLVWLLGPKLAENSSGSHRSRWQGMEVMWEDQNNSSMSCHPLAAFQTHSNSEAMVTWTLPLEHMVPEPEPSSMSLHNLSAFHT